MKHHIAPKSHCHFLLPLPRRTNFDFSSQHTVSQTADARTFAGKKVFFLLLLGKSSDGDDSETLIFSLRKVGRCHFLRLPFSEEGEGNEFLSPQKKIFHSLPRTEKKQKRKKKCGVRVGPGPVPVIFWMRRRRRRTILQFFYRSFFAPFPSPYLGGRETIFLSLLFFRVGPEFIIFNSPRLSACAQGSSSPSSFYSWPVAKKIPLAELVGWLVVRS